MTRQTHWAEQGWPTNPSVAKQRVRCSITGKLGWWRNEKVKQHGGDLYLLVLFDDEVIFNHDTSRWAKANDVELMSA